MAREHASNLPHIRGGFAFCRCADCRHARFNPGPPSMTKRQARNRAHSEALRENARRDMYAQAMRENPDAFAASAPQTKES